METLSDKETGINCISLEGSFRREDVKEFIQQLKEKIMEKPIKGFDYPNTIEDVPDMIDELAGEKLI